MKKTRFGKAFAEARGEGDRTFEYGGKKYNTGLKGESGKQTVKALDKNYEKFSGVPRQVASAKPLEANRPETALMPSRGVTPIEREGKRKGLRGLIDKIRYNRMKRAERRAEGGPKVTENTGDFIRGMGKGNATDMLRQAIANRSKATPTAGPTKEGPSATKAVAEANAASNQKTETKSSPASNFVTGAGPGNARTALQQQLSTAVSTESLQDKAKRVMRGDYGAGADRKAKLGSEYESVQAEVNKMMKAKKKYMGGGMMKKYAKGGEVKRVNGMAVDAALHERMMKDRLKAPSRKPDVDNTGVSRPAGDKISGKPKGELYFTKDGFGINYPPVKKKSRKLPPGMTPYNPGKKQSPKVEAKNDSTSNLDTYGSIRDNYYRREKKGTTNFSYMGGGKMEYGMGGKMDKKKAFMEMIAKLKAKKK